MRFFVDFDSERACFKRPNPLGDLSKHKSYDYFGGKNMKIYRVIKKAA